MQAYTVTSIGLIVYLDPHRVGNPTFTVSLQSQSKVADITLVIRGSVRNV